MLPKLALPFAFLFVSIAALCQTDAGTIPVGTPLALTIDQHLPMRRGQPIRAQSALPGLRRRQASPPERRIVTGSVVELRSDRSRRVHAILGGDFTPFHTPVVQFTQIILADGSIIPLASTTATDGAPIYRAVAPPSPKAASPPAVQRLLTVARTDMRSSPLPAKATVSSSSSTASSPTTPSASRRAPRGPSKPPPLSSPRPARRTRRRTSTPPHASRISGSNPRRLNRRLPTTPARGSSRPISPTQSEL